MKRYQFTSCTLLALAAAALLTAAPAQAQFQDRNLRLSSSVPKEHPQGAGVTRLAACTLLQLSPAFCRICRHR